MADTTSDDTTGRPARAIRRQGQPVQLEQTHPRARDLSAAGYQALAAGVLAQVHRDILRKVSSQSTAHRVEQRIAAIRYLSTESSDLQFWCDVAGLSMHEVIRATKATHGARLVAYEALAEKLRRKEQARIHRSRSLLASREWVRQRVVPS